MSASKKYIIGTRGSLLAVTQTTLMKKELEKLTGDQFEIKTIKTEGDIKTNAPLWQLEGKDFFTKELDHALLNNEIDLIVHSYKDLGSDRPDGIKLAAITERKFAHDILLYSPDFLNKKEVVIGTSSPRRITNIENHLNKVLFPENEKSLELKMLRGNVNTRIEKLRNGEYDAIVLAFAGLERLTKLDSSKEKLEELLKDLNFCVLPQSSFTSSASQGALAIECLETRNDQGELFNKIQKLEHAQTKTEVGREREIFQSYGGGCHLAVGIHVKSFSNTLVEIEHGQVDDKKIARQEMVLKDFSRVENKEQLFIGMPPGKIEEKGIISDEILEKVDLEVDQEKYQKENKVLFVTSGYCLKVLKKIYRPGDIIFASGARTFRLIREAGYWVHGSADSFGHQEIKNFKDAGLIQILSQNKPWYVLSRKESESEIAEVIPCYEYKTHTPSDEQLSQVKSCAYFYWTSFSQYQEYLKYIPELSQKKHFCGLGKTFDRFHANNVSVTPLISYKTFMKLFS